VGIWDPSNYDFTLQMLGFVIPGHFHNSYSY
jgi:hypothetical protein